LLLWAGLLFGCRPEGESWQRIQESGVLRVGLDPTYPPFEILVGEVVQGLDIDLAQAIGHDLGLEVEFVYFGFDGLYDALATEQVDVLISALVIAPERTRDFAFSDSYFDAGQILVSPQTLAAGRMEELVGRSLAVELGTQGHVEATNWARRLDGLSIQPHNTTEEALTAVVDGRADAALVDSVSGRLFASDQDSLTVSQDMVASEPYAMVVRIEDRLLLEKLDESLQRLRSSGQLAAIVGKWLDSV
jgi:ABC-type amino acid transport substrate-binding protein